MKSAHKNNVPLYVGNSDEGMHCMHASFVMALNGLKPNEPIMSLEEFDVLVEKPPGKSSWFPRACTHLAIRGFKIKSASLFDFKAFLQNPEDCFIDFYGEESGRWQIENSDIPQFVRDVTDAVNDNAILFEKREPDFDDIKRELAEGNYVIPELNHRTLIGVDGYDGHYIVIFGYNEDGVIAHNPGDKVNGRHSHAFYPWALFDKAWSWPEQRNRNYVSIGLR